jgi:hypothetical protein
MSSTGPQRSTPCSRWYPEPLRGECPLSIGWMNPPASRPASCSIVMIWTPLAFRLAASTRATWPASLVCTTTVRRAVIAISSTKDQANPNQLHSFTSKPTTRPRPYAVDASQRRQFPPPSDVHRQPECDYWVTPSCWPTASPFFWRYHYCQRLQNWVSPKFSHASDTRSRAAIMGHCDIEPGTLPATFVEELTVL